MTKMVKNTTTQNRTKREKLSTTHVVPKHLIRETSTATFLKKLLTLPHSKETILFNIGKTLVGDSDNFFYQKFIHEYNYDTIQLPPVPVGEFDLLGVVYQFLNTKYENLSLGSFYTSKDVVCEIFKNIPFTRGDTLIDPSCGSGVFLFAGDLPPENIIGVDYDPVAVMIAKFNFFLKFPHTTVAPQIHQADFIDWYTRNPHKRYTYVVGNPPYGANMNFSRNPSTHITTGESFSYFVEYGFNLLEEGGTMCYLLPEAFLNVKRHADIRNLTLESLNITRVKKYDTKFSGVMSDIYEVTFQKTSPPSVNVSFIDTPLKTHTPSDDAQPLNTQNSCDDANTEDTVRVVEVPKTTLKSLKNQIFTPLTLEDIVIIEKVQSSGKYDLKSSTFALGVVTGNNTEKLLPTPIEGVTEPIFTGKEVEKYQLSPPQKHIIYDRAHLQQVAPDNIYRAPEKLVYKVISKRMKVAIDTNQKLTSSSANIIIPHMPHNTIYTTALLLNSDLYTFVNQKLHGHVNKMSKENFQALPFPAFSEEEQHTIMCLIQNYLTTPTNDALLQQYVYNFFGITEKEQQYIHEHVQ